MLVFVNYAHFSKTCRNYASTFYLQFGKNTSISVEKKTKTSKWQTHLPYLHLRTLRVNNSLSDINCQTIKNQHEGTILGNRGSYAHALGLVQGPRSLPVGSRSHKCEN